mgnify:FL=1|tara:strand:- start:1622 stop:2032 length:411 start_codon:yes stop_codon:yes gene_type:complete
MFQRRQKSFRHRPRGRTGSPRHSNGQGRSMSNNFSNGPMRNNFRGNTQSAEKLFEKYNTLAKEALSSGDKTLSENYFQHADHFVRIIEDKNKNYNQNKIQNNEKISTDDKGLSPSNTSEAEPEPEPAVKVVEEEIS